VNAVEPTGAPEDSQTPGGTLADAARELQGLMRMQRTRERAAREARHLEQLTAQSARRRAPAEQPDDEPAGAP
jgi:hypothetical protein